MFTAALRMASVTARQKRAPTDGKPIQRMQKEEGLRLIRCTGSPSGRLLERVAVSSLPKPLDQRPHRQEKRPAGSLQRHWQVLRMFPNESWAATKASKIANQSGEGEVGAELRFSLAVQGVMDRASYLPSLLLRIRWVLSSMAEQCRPAPR